MSVAIKLDLVRRVTDEELLALSQRNPGYQFERSADGRLVVSPTGGESGRRSAEVLRQLSNWNARTGLGYVFDPSTGFKLPDGALLSPDASWVRRARWEALAREAREGFPPLCPDVVFEVRSASNPLAELREKMQSYLANGAQLAVLIDPEGHAVELYRPGREGDRHEEAVRVILEPELPGFTLELAPIFG